MPKFHLHSRPNKKGQHPINLMYSFNGMRLNYSTGISIDPKFFNPECNTNSRKNPISEMPKSAHIPINDTLKEMRLKAQSIVQDADFDDLSIMYVTTLLNESFNKQRLKKGITQIEGEPDADPTTVITYFEKAIQDAKAGKRVITNSAKKEGARYSISAIKNHGTTLSAIKRYFKYSGIKDLPLTKLDESFYQGFKDYCYEVENKEVSSFAGYMKDIKSIIGRSKTPNFDPNIFKKPTYESHAIALSLKQLDQLQKLDLSNNPRFDNARDLFLVGCYTALRYADYSNLLIDNIEDGFIRVRQKKTNTLVTIPVLGRLQTLIDKRDGSLPKSVTNQELNRTIKHVAQLAGLTQKITVKRTSGNVNTFENIELYKLISSHTARRSYATIMFEKKVPPMLIMSATGHKSESSFIRYIRKNQEDLAMLLADNLKQLGL